MAKERREPETEEEARDLKRYLERGGQVELETQRAIATKSIAARAVVFDATVADVTELVKDPETDRVIVEIELHNAGSSSDPPLQVFLNRPDASPDEGARDPAFIGTIAFFVHDDAAGGVGKDMPDQHSIKVRLDATEAVRQTKARGPLTVHLVPFPGAVLKPSASRVQVTAAKVEVVKSTVRENE